MSPSAARELDRCRGLWGSLYQPFAGHLERSSDECSDAGREDEDELARESSLSFEAGETDDVLGASFDPFSAGGMASSEDDGANAAEDNSRETVTPPEPKTTRSCLLQMLQQVSLLPVLIISESKSVLTPNYPAYSAAAGASADPPPTGPGAEHFMVNAGGGCEPCVICPACQQVKTPEMEEDQAASCRRIQGQRGLQGPPKDPAHFAKVLLSPSSGYDNSQQLQLSVLHMKSSPMPL